MDEQKQVKTTSIHQHMEGTIVGCWVNSNPIEGKKTEHFPYPSATDREGTRVVTMMKKKKKKRTQLNHLSSLLLWLTFTES